MRISVIGQSVRMAFSNIRNNKMRSFLTMLGIVIGVASVIALITIVSSVTGSVVDQFEALGAGTLTITATVGQDGILRFEGIPGGEFVIKETKAPEGYNILTEEIKVGIDFNTETEEFTYTGAVDNNGLARITVINQAGSELPSTGGIGTTLFYVIGGVMAVAALILLIAKKRMANAQ